MNLTISYLLNAAVKVGTKNEIGTSRNDEWVAVIMVLD
jgi:hypothetical protein